MHASPRSRTAPTPRASHAARAAWYAAARTAGGCAARPAGPNTHTRRSRSASTRAIVGSKGSSEHPQTRSIRPSSAHPVACVNTCVRACMLEPQHHLLTAVSMYLSTHSSAIPPCT
eukprot:1145068-Pelagomonas_calceolata.AAC.3